MVNSTIFCSLEKTLIYLLKISSVAVLAPSASPSTVNVFPRERLVGRNVAAAVAKTCLTITQSLECFRKSEFVAALNLNA